MITITTTSTTIVKKAKTATRAKASPRAFCGSAAMPRVKGTGKHGPTRSTRLPLALDRWFCERLEFHPANSPSELLIALIHGGLRLRDGYMLVHRRTLERYLISGRQDQYDLYMSCLLDTFGPDYVRHLERWLEADSIAAR
jgi:hypothetical protein